MKWSPLIDEFHHHVLHFRPVKRPLARPETAGRIAGIFRSRAVRAVDPQMRLHLGFVIAIVLVVIVFLVIKRTPFGLQMRAVGASKAGSQSPGST